MGIIKPVIEVENDLKVREELIGIHAMNPFLECNSASRMYMFSSHFSQALTLLWGDSKIVQTGLEAQFAKNTFSKKADSDCTVLRVISRYSGMTVNCGKSATEMIVIVMDNETGEIDYINIPYYHTLHQYFGFKYNWDYDKISELSRGYRLKKGDILADSPAVGVDGSYKYGVNANIALMRLPESAEDGVVISKSLSEKLSYKVFEKRVINFGADKFPLNLYGDDENYKAFPEIGQQVNEESILMALRPVDDGLAPALMTKHSLREYDKNFDELFYVRGPGEDKILNGYTIKSGTVVDIKAVNSPKFKKYIHTGTADDAMKYVNGYKKYYDDILNAEADIRKEHKSLYGEDNLKISEKLQRLLNDAYAIVNPDNAKLVYSFRKDMCDIIRIEIIVEYTLCCKVGSKLSDSQG